MGRYSGFRYGSCEKRRARCDSAQCAELRRGPMHSPVRAWNRFFALAVALSLMVPALTALAAQDEGKVLRIHHQVYPDVVDPQKSSFANEIDILALAYEGLTRFDTEL